MFDLDLAEHAAFYSAANVVVKLDPTSDSLNWIRLGQAGGYGNSEYCRVLAQFVRDCPTASAADLWFHAVTELTLHADPYGFYNAPPQYQIAYSVFQNVLLAVDNAQQTIDWHRKQRERLAASSSDASR